MKLTRTLFVSFTVCISACLSDINRGYFIAGCMKSELSKSTCSCAYDKLEDKYTSEELKRIYSERNFPSDFAETVKKSVLECN